MTDTGKKPNSLSDFPTYQFDVEEETTFGVASGSGETVFSTDADGTYTPKNAEEDRACRELGATRKE